MCSIVNICTHKAHIFGLQFYCKEMCSIVRFNNGRSSNTAYKREKGMSQEVVSGLADIGRTHLSAIERGNRKPTMETFYKIANAMGIKASELMREIENEIDK